MEAMIPTGLEAIGIIVSRCVLHKDRWNGMEELGILTIQWVQVRSIFGDMIAPAAALQRVSKQITYFLLHYC